MAWSSRFTSSKAAVAFSLRVMAGDSNPAGNQIPGVVTVTTVTPAFQLASEFVDEACAANPVLSTQLGVPGSDQMGADFDLREFHSEVMSNGPMRLDLLREVVLGQLAG